MYIVKCGNCTPLGERAGTTATSFRAGFSMIAIIREYEDENWQPVRMGLAEYLDEYLDMEEQFQELALPALEEVLPVLEKYKISLSELPVLIGLPENRPGLPPGLKQSLQDTLSKASDGLKFPFKFEFFEQGHTAFLTALEKATSLLQDSGFCIVGGVDSYNDADTIHWLEHDLKRLLCSTSKDGFIPGQAAGFVLLASESAMKKYRLKPQARVLGVALDKEENDFESGKLSTARGLTPKKDIPIGTLKSIERQSGIKLNK